MAETYFRLHPKDEDPEKLLDPDEQKTEPWGGTIYGKCDKCGGEGKTKHECESCKAGSRDPDCESCGGKVTWEEECPACEGSGEIDDSERDGISVFPDEDGLYRYMRERDADIGDSVLLVLEGKESSDEDFDADEGALLIHPTKIVDVREPQPSRG